MIQRIIFSLIFFTNIYALDIKDTNEIFTVKSEDKFEDAYLNLKNEIIHNGFIIVHELDLAKSTGKVAEAFEKNAVFKKAKNIMICKSTLTLEMHEENIENITYCPMVISVYEYENTAYISYRKYHKYNSSNFINQKINKLLKDVVLKSMD